MLIPSKFQVFSKVFDIFGIFEFFQFLMVLWWNEVNNFKKKSISSKLSYFNQKWQKIKNFEKNLEFWGYKRQNWIKIRYSTGFWRYSIKPIFHPKFQFNPQMRLFWQKFVKKYFFQNFDKFSKNSVVSFISLENIHDM